MKTISTPRDLLVSELKDLHSAETQLLAALPKMAEAASSDELREAFEIHLKQTQVHVERLEKIGQQLGEAMTGKKCKAMAGLVAEGAEVIDEDAKPAMHDLALIGAAQKAEHYEIAGYGTSRTLAEMSGEDKIAGILQETLDEEGETDKLLTRIATELDLDSADEDEEDETDDDKEDEAPPAKSKAAKPAMAKAGAGAKSANKNEEVDIEPASKILNDGDGKPMSAVAGMDKKNPRR